MIVMVFGHSYPPGNFTYGLDGPMEIEDFPTKNGDSRWQTVKLPDGKWASSFFSNSHTDHAADDLKFTDVCKLALDSCPRDWSSLGMIQVATLFPHSKAGWLKAQQRNKTLNL